MLRHALMGAVLLCGAVIAAPKTSHDGPRWRLENASLRVDIDAQRGTFEVLDKQAQYLWRGPREGPATTVLLVSQATQPLQLDGELGEWSAQGALVEITPQMLTAGSAPDGPEDCSGRVRVAWSGAGVLLAGAIKDDKVVFPAANEGRWWERDTVEFWLGETQYALRLSATGANVWSQAGNVGDARVAFRQTATGYEFEALMPARLIPDAIKAGPGGKFRFAVGINDSDGAGRQCQLYYPASWAHSNPATFAEAVLTDASGTAPGERTELQAALEPVSEKAGEATFKTMIQSGGKSFPGTVTFALVGEGPDLRLTVDTADHALQVGRFGVLHPLVLDRPGRILAAAYCDGIGVPTDDMSWRGRTWTTYGSLDMPWVGVTDGKIGYMLLWELPVACDNGAVVFETLTLSPPLPGGEGGKGSGSPPPGPLPTGEGEKGSGSQQKVVLAPAVRHDPIRKQFGAARTVRYSFCADGGHVTICKRFREYVKGQGLLVTQREKMRRKPQLARLLGAPDIWGRSDLKFCQEAHAAGIDRMLVNSPQSAADMEKIKALGYLMGVYDNYEDAFEGDQGRYGDFREAEDVEINAAGQPVKAWLTKGEKPKQFMKRCAMLYEQVARKWIPRELAIYPYNARFIDVTTATGLRECYSERHPYDRMRHRESNRKLARYVGDELNLVLGGEHGRWWGADIYNYWEGMQSGGFYSWPAGHVGLELPQTREAIGKAYLEWGLGEKNRYPLWELVYHDCVVSTWYWGDSTGHLQAVAPELGYKQDAFNVLYGTVPLYWVNKPYSYDWSKPELRERLLESYRNTCKLHEVIGFEELVSHEFVTADRAVQHTGFGDGTNVWVNFGEQPWALKQGTKKWVLPQYGFYVKGPRIEQYRVVEEGRAETMIRSDGYLYASHSVPGVIEFEGGGVTCQVEGPGRVRLILAPDTENLRLQGRALAPGKAAGAWWLMETDGEGEAQRLVAVKAEGQMLLVEAQGRRSVTVLSPEAMSDHAEVMWQGLQASKPGRTKQGQRVAITGNLQNVGGQAVKRATVRLMLRTAPPLELAAQTVDLPPKVSKPVSFQFDSTLYDGNVPLELVVERQPKELCLQDNRLAFALDIAADWALWDGHIDVEVKAQANEVRPLVRMPLDLKAERVRLGVPGEGDPDSVRVVMIEGEVPRRSAPEDDKGKVLRFAQDDMVVCPAQLVPGEKGMEVLWEMPRAMKPGESAVCRVYFDRATPKRHRQTAVSRWNAERTTFANDLYSVRFADGYIRGVWVGATQVMANVGTSSKDTGWVDEQGPVQSFEVLSDGPVCTQVRVKKALAGGHAYDKLYSFYPDHFTVAVLSPEIYGVMSRAYYLADADYEDDKGNQARIDGQGDAEGVMGKNPKPQWYATWGPGWAVIGVPVTPHDNVCYWDGGAKAGLGFTSGRTKEPPTVAYFMHVTKAGGAKATELAVADRARLARPVVVKRVKD